MPNRAEDALLFIYLAEDCSEDNPLSTMRFDEKEEEARRLVYGNKYLDSVYTPAELRMIDAAREEVNNLYVTDYHKDVRAYDKKIDQMSDLLNDTKPTIVKNTRTSNENVTFSSNIDIINNILKDIVGLVTTKTMIIDSYVNGSSGKSIRGMSKSPLESGLLST
jgi:hypothetical protein